MSPHALTPTMVSLACFASVHMLAAHHLHAQCTPTWSVSDAIPGIQGETSNTGGTIGEINCSIVWDPDGAGPAPSGVVVGGTFAYAGDQRANNIAFWNGSSWRPLLGGVAGGPPLAFAIAPDNSLLVGGAFSVVDGTPTNSIAKWNGTSWSALGDGVDSAVQGIVVRANGDLVVTGSFNVAGASVVARGVARWNGTSWFAINQGLRTGTTGNEQGYGNAIAMLANGDILVGGTFDRAGGTAAANIARLRFNANGSTSWFALGTGTDAYVDDIDILPNGNAIVGGNFLTAGGVTVNGIARWTGTTWSALGSGMDEQSVIDVAHRSNGDIIAAGVFEHVGGTLMRGVAQWNGSAWSPLAGLDTYHWSFYSTGVYSLTNLPSGDLFLGGVFKAGHVVWNGTSFSHYGQGMDGDVTSLVTLPSGDVVAGGTFETAGTGAMRHVARRAAGVWQPMGAGLSFAPTRLFRLQNGNILAAGAEVAPGGGAATFIIAQWDGTAWSTFSTGMSPGTIKQLANGDIITAGYANGTGAVYRWNGTDWEVFHNGIVTLGGPGFAYALEVLPDGSVVVGGSFEAINGVAATNIARWDGTAWQAMSFGLGNADGGDGIASLQAWNGGLIASGNFMSDAAAQQLDNIAFWNGTVWQPLVVGLPLGGASVLAALPDGRLLAAGSVEHAMQAWDGSTWTAIGPVIEGSVNAVALLPDGSIGAGGTFAYIAGASHAHYAEYACIGATCDSIDFNSDGLFPDTADIDDFLSVFSGGPCSTGTCNDIDFNNDGLFPDTADIDSLLSVFSGGACL